MLESKPRPFPACLRLGYAIRIPLMLVRFLRAGPWKQLNPDEPVPEWFQSSFFLATMAQEGPLDLSLPEGERLARQEYLRMLQSRPDYLGCWDCLMVFTDPFMFSLHHSTHDATKSLTCACGAAFTSRSDFQKHVIEEPHSV